MKCLVFLLFLSIIGCSSDFESSYNQYSSQKESHWQELGDKVAGFSLLDIRKLKYLDDQEEVDTEDSDSEEVDTEDLDSEEVDTEDSDSQEVDTEDSDSEEVGTKELEKDLISLINNPKKTKAVIQVVDLLPSGSVCGGCVRKGNLIARAILKDKELAASTTYVMVISGDYTPQKEVVAFARRFLDQGTIVVRDIDGKFQNNFGKRKYPITVVLESGFRGRILNMHGAQPSSIIRALKSLPK